MVTWMHHHDAYWHHDTFLNWAKAEGIVEEDDEAEPKRKRQRGDDESEVRVCRGYKVAKKPGYGDMTVDDLIKYHAMDKWFTWYLDEFLGAHSIPIPPSHNISFGIFKYLSVTLPQIPQVSDPDRKSTRLNSSHQIISYAVFCLKKKKKHISTPNLSQYD